MSNLKKEHREILDKIETYLSNDGGEHLRFTQALFNLGINSFEGNNPETGVFRDNYNDTDESVLRKISWVKKKINKKFGY